MLATPVRKGEGATGRLAEDAAAHSSSTIVAMPLHISTCTPRSVGGSPPLIRAASCRCAGVRRAPHESASLVFRICPVIPWCQRSSGRSETCLIRQGTRMGFLNWLLSDVPKKEDLLGSWEGTISGPQGKFRAVMVIELKDEGTGALSLFRYCGKTGTGSADQMTEFSGRLLRTSKHALYKGSDGTAGKVTVIMVGPERTEKGLRFRRDDGRASSEWRRLSPQISP